MSHLQIGFFLAWAILASAALLSFRLHRFMREAASWHRRLGQFFLWTLAALGLYSCYDSRAGWLAPAMILVALIELALLAPPIYAALRRWPRWLRWLVLALLGLLGLGGAAAWYFRPTCYAPVRPRCYEAPLRQLVPSSPAPSPRTRLELLDRFAREGKLAPEAAAKARAALARR